MKVSRFLISLLCGLMLIGCNKNRESEIINLSGYWEIEKVIFPNGETKIYKYNDAIDYISINDSLKGFRKKLKPNFDGSFSKSNDEEGITLKIENDSLNLYYKTPYTNWKETVLEVSATDLKILNSNEIVYLYKRYEPLDLNFDDQ